MPTKIKKPEPGPVRWSVDKVVEQRVSDLKPYPQNARKHTAESTAKLAKGIQQFGFVVPILVNEENDILAGHGRLEAAKALGMKTVPTVVLDHLSKAEERALRLADNKLAEASEWDMDFLKIELGELIELSLDGALDFDIDVIGFDTPEFDIILAEPKEKATRETVEAPDASEPVVSRVGDLWVLGQHRLLCGDALSGESYTHVLDGRAVGMMFTDPPYNVPIQGHVRSGNATGVHREFAMASGEMSDAEFRTFLDKGLSEKLGLRRGRALASVRACPSRALSATSKRRPRSSVWR